MVLYDPDHRQGHYLDFTNAQGMRFRLQVEDDAADDSSFVLRVTYLIDRAGETAEASGSDDPLAVLTAREREVALLVAECLTNEQISDRLCISISTVKSHIQSIFSKMQVANRTALVARLHGSARLFR